MYTGIFFSMVVDEDQKDVKKAIELFQRTFRFWRELQPAMRKLAQYYQDGQGVSVDIDKAISLLNNAADAGDDQAMFELSNLYSTGDGVPIDMPRAVSLLQRAYKMGHRDSQVAVGWGLLTGAYDMKRDVHRAVPILKKVAHESYGALAVACVAGLSFCVFKRRARIVDAGSTPILLNIMLSFHTERTNIQNTPR
ncbi:hypothetical protein Pelo_18966 [Pelomyxa schiedti]|nr:hypothetical protein Pelo_18966 [Pelomyxa schiedti]